MKTLNLISALTVLIFTMTTFEINASTPDLNLKGFDFGGNEIMENRMSVNNSFENNALPDFNFEEETYIKDIPFNTKCVTAKCRYEKAILVVFDLEEEAYINDIPFNTKNIAENNNTEEFDLKEEAYIDDIPFNTESIAENNNTEEFDFEDEAYINDIPFNTLNIAVKAEFKNNLTVK